MTRLEEIAARCEAATPGPMVALSSIPNPRIVKESDFYNSLATIMGSKDYGGREYHQAVADANFFAHSREDIPWLLSELAHLTTEVTHLAIESIEREKQLAKLEAEVQHWADAEKDGRMVVLPCKPGDTIYYINYRQTVVQGIAEEIKVAQNGNFVIVSRDDLTTYRGFNEIYATCEAALEAAGGTE